MAQSKRKRQREIKHQKEAKQFWKVVGIITVILLVILYLVYSG